MSFFTRHAFLLQFMFLSITAGLSVGTAKVVNLLYALDMQASPLELGLLGGAQSIGLLFVGLPIGFLVERFGPRALFMFGSVGAAAIYMMMPLAPSPLWLIAIAAMGSFFMPFRFVSMNSVFLARMHTLGEARSGWIRATQMSGAFLLGPLLAAYMVVKLDFTTSYWLIVFTFIIGVTVAGKILPHRMDVPVNAAITPSGSGFFRQVIRLFRSGPVQAASISEFLIQFCNAYFMTFIVPLVVAVLHVNTAIASQFITAQGIAFVFALFAFGSLSARWGEVRFIAVACTVISLALLTMGIAASSVLLMAGAIVLGAGLGMLQLSNLTAFGRISAVEGRGRIAGVIALVGPVGSLSGAIAGGVVASFFGLRAMYFVLTTLFILLGVVTVIRALKVQPDIPLALD